MQPTLKGKNVVITGASGGIGKTTALALAREGANIVIAARRELQLEEVSIECERYGVVCYFYKMDVTVLDQVNNLLEFALDKLGSVDIWINNAGVGAVGSFTQTPMHVHEEVIKTNLFGYMYGAYVTMPYFKDKGCGILINNISLGAYVPNPFATAYSASKFGLRGFSEALRYELVDYKDIHICDVFPAFIDTPGFEHAANFIGKKIKPIPSVYKPEKVANTIVELCRHPHAQTMVGSSGRVAKAVHALTPKLLGTIMAKFVQTYIRGSAEVEKINQGSLFRSKLQGWKKLHPRRLLIKH